MNDECRYPIVIKAINFFNDACNVNPDPRGEISSWSWEIMVSDILSIGAAAAGILWGAKILGYVNMILLPIPVICVLVLVIVGTTMSGASDGIKQYIGKIDLSTLSSDVWQASLAQALFSLGAGQGGMMAFGSHNKRENNFFIDVWVIITGDTIFAFLAGLAVFSVLGHLAYDAGIPIEDLALMGQLQGSSLVFQTYPVGLSHFGAPWDQILCAVFFAMIWFLGFSSLMAQFETITVPLIQSAYFRARNIGRKGTVIGSAIIAFVIGQIFTMDMGMHLFDCLDYLNANLVTVYFCGAECVVGGWLCACDAQMEKCGKSAWLTHFGTYMGGSVLASMLGFLLKTDVGRIVGPVLGAVIICGGFGVSLYMSRRLDGEGNVRTFGTKVYDLTLGGVEDFRKLMNEGTCRDSCCKIPLIWCILVKYVVPLVCSIFLFLGMSGFYMDMPSPDRVYHTWIFVVGSLAPYAVLLLSLIGWAYPKALDLMVPPPEERVKFDFTKSSLEMETCAKDDGSSSVSGASGSLDEV
eukprot:GHVO01066849.1.p1 GENE.GHVO01066849.1~~GHVO01066849.1.p1  ORF type:complete len:523 (+),score=52.77 GHVO01066849.1:652-2220(+)